MVMSRCWADLWSALSCFHYSLCHPCSPPGLMMIGAAILTRDIPVGYQLQSIWPWGRNTAYVAPWHDRVQAIRYGHHSHAGAADADGRAWTSPAPPAPLGTGWFCEPVGGGSKTSNSGFVIVPTEHCRLRVVARFWLSNTVVAAAVRPVEAVDAPRRSCLDDVDDESVVQGFSTRARGRTSSSNPCPIQ